MKIAFDVDGLITENPKLFSVLSRALMRDGNEVCIITDFDELFRRQREDELKQLGIEYTELIITGKKEQYCRANGIQYMIDDDIGYFKNTPCNPVFIARFEE